MAEKKDPQSNPDLEPVGDTRRLEKATEELAASSIEGTLMSIEAHTGEHPIPQPDEASVTDSLKKAKGGAALPATMYGPTKPGEAKVGSTAATQFGPTNSARPPSGAVPMASGSGSMGTGGAAVAPFGGKIMVGTRVGQIEITGVLGKGGMGEVFRGYHHALDIQVAIKVLPDELSRNDLVRQRFLREARLCVKLDHPNIVRVYNVDEHAGNLFLVMEIIEGTDAANMLKNGGRFKYRRALEIGAASADALGYAHTQGLVHRDVKPHNILLGRDDGKIKLSDFGLARAATSSSHLTMSGQIMGTPHYMSPEQAESKEVTDKADVYSLGVTMYHMLTGETPFVGDTPISVAVQHIAKEILYPEARFAAFPKELVAVLKRMTAKDASKRCSAKQAAVWLRKLVSMAPADDIQVAPDAMNTLAPVVRESQAFEAAAKQREAQDERAREAARTMIATMREVAIPPTQAGAQAQPQAQSQPTITPMPQKKSGGVAAAAAVLLLLGGGGAAGWWFTMGPGAQKANNAPLIAGSNSDQTPGDNRDTIGVNTNSNGGGTTNQPANNAGNPPSNGGTDNPPANNSPDNPPATEDKFINNQLDSARNEISGADSLEALAKAEVRLLQVKAELSRASQRQKDEHADLEQRYKRQWALLTTREQVAAIREGLNGFRAEREGDPLKALAGLNKALIGREVLDKLEVPSEVLPLVQEERDSVLKDLASELESYEKARDAEAVEFERQKLYDKADEVLGYLAQLRLGTDKLDALKLRRAEVQTRGRLAAVASLLESARAGDDKKYKDADNLLIGAEKSGVPETQKAAFAAAQKSVKDAVETRFAAMIAAASKSVDDGKFAEAKATLRQASDVLPLQSDQIRKANDELFFISLNESIAAADKAITDDALSDAKLKLDDTKARMDASTDRAIPEVVTQRYDKVRQRFDAQLSQRFESELASAQAFMRDKDFERAGASIAKAEDLPLTPDQQSRLEDFVDANELALAEYLVELITTVEKALDANDFDTASEAIQKANALKVEVPKESRDKLVTLQARYSQKTIEIHTQWLEKGEKALAEKRYDAVKDALAQMAKLKDVGSRRDVESALAERFIAVLTEDVNTRLAAADKHVENGKYKDARAAIDGAAGLPLEPDLKERVRTKSSALDASIESRLAELLKKAAEARDAKQFHDSAKYLAEATDLTDVLSDPQKMRLSTATDENKSALRTHLDALFKELDGCVQRGQETEGKAVVAKIEKQPLGEGDKNRLKTANAALTGETESARFARLPAHLKKFGDRNIKPEQVFQVGEWVTAVFATHDGKYAACGTDTGKVVFYNLKRGTQLGQSTSGRRKVTSIAINAAGTVAVAGNDDGALVLFKLEGGAMQASTLESVGDLVTGTAFSADGKVLYVLTRKGEVTRFNTENRSKLGSTPSGIDGAMALALSPNGKHLAIGGKDAEIAVFDAARMVMNGSKVQAPGDDQIQSINFSADSKQMIAGSIGDDVAYWDTERLTVQPKRQLKGLGEWVRGVGFSADGRRSAGLDNETGIVVWDHSRSGDASKKYDFNLLVPKGEDITVGASWIAPDGSILIGTREGGLIHLTVKTPN